MKLFDIALVTNSVPREATAPIVVSWQGDCPDCNGKNSFFLSQSHQIITVSCVDCGIAESELFKALGTTEEELEVLPDELEVKSQRQLIADLSRKEAKSRSVRMEAVQEVNQIEWVTAKELLAEQTPEIAFRVEGLWPVGGNVLLSAQAKAGKSTMAMNLTKSLIEGSPFLGTFKTEKPHGKIAIADLELSRTNLQSWLSTIGVDTEDVLVIPMRGKASGFATALLDKQARGELAARFREENVEVLIIDPLSVLLNGAGIDENSNTDVGGMLRNGISALREEAGISDVLVIHHAGHGAKSRSRGASVIMDWPDALWTLTVDSNTTEDEADLTEGAVETASRYFKATGRDVEVPETVLGFNAATKQLSITAIGMNRQKAAFFKKITSQENAILSALYDAENHRIEGQNTLRDLAGLSGKSAKKPLDNLINSGMVEIEGGVAVRGRLTVFQLTDTGLRCREGYERDPGEIGADEYVAVRPLTTTVKVMDQ